MSTEGQIILKQNHSLIPFWNSYFPDSFKHKGTGDTSSNKKQFTVLVLDLFVACFEDPNMAIAMGMSERFYKAK